MREGVSNRRPPQNMTKTLEIVLNGDKHEVPDGLTISDLLNTLGVDPTRVAVEYDRRILKTPTWGETRLHEGATVEIVHFVGGG
jgi:thiamine biosynthesis protein ThiS